MQDMRSVLDNLSRRLRKKEEQTTKKMQVIYGDVNIGVKGEGFLAMFSKVREVLHHFSMMEQSILHGREDGLLESMYRQ